MDENELDEMNEQTGSENETVLDKADFAMLRLLVEQYLAKYMKDYGWWTNPITYQPWMDDAIAEYESNKRLYVKLTKMMEEAE